MSSRIKIVRPLRGFIGHCSGEICSLKTLASQICAEKYRPPESCPANLRAEQVRLGEIGLLKAAASKHCILKVRLGEARS